jgi:hypothetical protein
VDDDDDDNDGIPDVDDDDDDNDGIKDENDTPKPTVPCSSAKITVPNDEYQTGTSNISVGWKLLPKGCLLTAKRNTKIHVYASNPYASDSPNPTNNVAVGKQKAKLTIPNNCDWDRSTTQKITYDFSEIGAALGDANADTPAYTQIVTHPVGQGACKSPDEPASPEEPASPDTPPAVDPTRISHHKDAECTIQSSGAVSCKDGARPQGNPAQYYYVWTNVTKALPIGYYQSAPTWNATGASYMNIYFGSCDTKSAVYSGGASEWEALLAANVGCTVRADYRDGAGAGWTNRPYPGNFILKIGTPDTTISKYNIPTPASNAVNPAIELSNIMRAKGAGVSCLQTDPGSPTVTCNGEESSQYWLYASPVAGTPLSNYDPSWTTTPTTTKMEIYFSGKHKVGDDCLKKVTVMAALGKPVWSKIPPSKSGFYYTNDQDGRANLTTLADVGCMVGTIEQSPGAPLGHGDWINSAKQGNFFLKVGTHTSITVEKYSLGN